MSAFDGLEREDTTVQNQTYKHLFYEIEMSEKEVDNRIYRRTVGGISQTMASKSQTTPLQTKNDVSNKHHNEKRNHHTWF